jgi:hypothetical protein
MKETNQAKGKIFNKLISHKAFFSDIKLFWAGDLDE